MSKSTTIIIDPDFQALCRAHTPEEAALFKASMDKYGMLEPVLCWESPEGPVLIDGHHRYNHHAELGFEVDYTPVEGIENRQQALEWIRDHQMGRRNQTPQDRAMLIASPVFAPTAKVGKPAKGEGKAIKTQTDAAEEAGVSRATLNRDKDFAKGVEVLEKVAPETAKAAKEGKVTKESVEKVGKAAKAGKAPAEAAKEVKAPRAKKPVDAPPPDEPEPHPVDPKGLPVAKEHLAIFSDGAIMSTWQKAVSEVAKAMTKVPEMSFGPGVLDKEIRETLLRARGLIMEGKPTTKCPHCKPSAKPVKLSKCDACHGKTWLNGAEFRNLTSDEKVAMGLPLE